MSDFTFDQNAALLLLYLAAAVVLTTASLFIFCHILKVTSSFLTSLLQNLILLIVVLWLFYAFGRYVDNADRQPLIDLANAAEIERIRSAVRSIFDYKTYTPSTVSNWISGADALRWAAEYYNNATSWIIKR